MLREDDDNVGDYGVGFYGDGRYSANQIGRKRTVKRPQPPKQKGGGGSKLVEGQIYWNGKDYVMYTHNGFVIVGKSTATGAKRSPYRRKEPYTRGEEMGEREEEGDDDIVYDENEGDDGTTTTETQEKK